MVGIPKAEWVGEASFRYVPRGFKGNVLQIKRPSEIEAWIDAVYLAQSHSNKKNKAFARVYQEGNRDATLKMEWVKPL